MSAAPDLLVRAQSWLEQNAKQYLVAPAEGGGPGLEVARAVIRGLHEAGLVGITWPPSVGGQGGTEDDERAVVGMLQGYHLPLRAFRVGLGTVGPTIVDIGTDLQRTTLCPAILRGDHIWCQLFSEPEAGSDLAGLRTRARRTETGFIVQGRKVWTSSASDANRGALLARTDPDRSKHRGLTMLLIDLDQPGIIVRPLRDMSGRTLFSEVIIGEAYVPDDMVLGAVDDGWAVADRMLRHERAAVASGIGRGESETRVLSFENVRRLHARHGVPSEGARADLVDLFMRHYLVELIRLRLTQESDAGAELGARESMAKLLIGRCDITAAQLASRILGPAAAFADDDPEIQAVLLAVTSSPGLAIAGGTEEIQKNIIGERILGLPRESSPEQGLTFRQIHDRGLAGAGERP